MKEEAMSTTSAEIEELRGDETLCQWMAHLMNKPIPIPGDEYVQNLAATIPELFDMSNQSSKAIAHFKSFLEEVQDESDLAELQQTLAVDRTSLFRGVREDGVKPPYEEFYRAKGEGSMSDMNRLMREARIAPAESNHERVDYLGNELALAAYLYRRVIAAEDAEAMASAEDLLERLLHDHLARWAPRYCDAALPYAKTEFFKGLLAAIGELFEDAGNE